MGTKVTYLRVLLVREAGDEEVGNLGRLLEDEGGRGRPNLHSGQQDVQPTDQHRRCHVTAPCEGVGRGGGWDALGYPPATGEVFRNALQDLLEVGEAEVLRVGGWGWG